MIYTRDIGNNECFRDILHQSETILQDDPLALDTCGGLKTKDDAVRRVHMSLGNRGGIKNPVHAVFEPGAREPTSGDVASIGCKSGGKVGVEGAKVTPDMVGGEGRRETGVGHAIQEEVIGDIGGVECLDWHQLEMFHVLTSGLRVAFKLGQLASGAAVRWLVRIGIGWLGAREIALTDGSCCAQLVYVGAEHDDATGQ